MATSKESSIMVLPKKVAYAVAYARLRQAYAPDGHRVTCLHNAHRPPSQTQTRHPAQVDSFATGAQRNSATPSDDECKG